MKKFIIAIFLLTIIGVSSYFIFRFKKTNIKDTTKTLEGEVLLVEGNQITFLSNNKIYIINGEFTDIKTCGLTLKYKGEIDENKKEQNISIVSYEENQLNSNIIYPDNGLFSDYYLAANEKLKNMSLDEKIGQLIMGRYNDNAINDIKQYHLGGFVLFAKDFQNKNEEEVIQMISDLQNNSDIPLLIAVDEEGGSVVRVSSNPLLAITPFKSPRELYNIGGLEEIKKDTINKSNFLNKFGINLNLAPVVDIATNSSDYMYQRSLGYDAIVTSDYTKTVIENSKGTHVSYTLKHFPGYGNNSDTHMGISVDTRNYNDIVNNDLKPFEAGIKAGCEAIMVSHNIVTSIDNTMPSSLSLKIHNLLRDDLGFTGVTITDDLAMGAITNIEKPSLKAIQAHNNLLITTDYVNSIKEIKASILEGTLKEEDIDNLVLRVLAWKYYKGLMDYTK